MLGFGDLGVALAFLTTLGSAILCVVYGLARWNADEDSE
jgi:hypothetical protein